MSAANKAVIPPMVATVACASGTKTKSGVQRATRYTPAVTIVAAWMRALTGVGPSIASGNHRCSGNWALEPESDQQIAAQSHGFPKNKQHEEIARHHEHAHRKHEQRQLRKEPRIARVAVHVAARINGDQRADKRNHREHHGRHRVNLDVDMNV